MSYRGLGGGVECARSVRLWWLRSGWVGLLSNPCPIIHVVIETEEDRFGAPMSRIKPPDEKDGNKPLNTKATISTGATNNRW